MKSAISVLKTNDYSANFDFNYLEGKYGLIIPPIFRIYLSNFKYEPFEKQVIFLPDEEIGFGNFGNNIEEAIHGSLHVDDEFSERKMIQFASSGIHAGGLCIGTQGEDIDIVFLDSEEKERFVKIADNIFHFLRGLMVIS